MKNKVELFYLIGNWLNDLLRQVICLFKYTLNIELFQDGNYQSSQNNNEFVIFYVYTDEFVQL